MLCTRCQRPRDRRAAEQRDELAADHSITSSARARPIAPGRVISTPDRGSHLPLAGHPGGISTRPQMGPKRGGSDDAPNATPRAGAASSMLFVPVGGFRLILNRMPEPLHNEFRNLARSAAQSRNVERKPCTAVSRGPPCPIHTWPGGPMAKRCAGIACGSAVVPYKIPDLWDRAAA
jgi:hypothetical protein